ncbi:hypothetical protein EVAR_76493_1 [Eumeta japonica]|uniref:Uncharacterized protein n=1 Tax=Eumeta variegata TaxID=151549 RepID=A0A4C1T4W6_EUMVA|nr:hypothetical protein EVAR_76493_1 [Eumeta japonica]
MKLHPFPLFITGLTSSNVVALTGQHERPPFMTTTEENISAVLLMIETDKKVTYQQIRTSLEKLLSPQQLEFQNTLLQQFPTSNGKAASYRGCGENEEPDHYQARINLISNSRVLGPVCIVAGALMTTAGNACSHLPAFYSDPSGIKHYGKICTCIGVAKA